MKVSKSNSGVLASGGAVVASDLTVDGTTITVDESANTVGIGTSTPGAKLEIQDTTTSSANAGGSLRLSANDGAPMGDSHRLGVIEFTGAEDSSNTQVVGARIEALTDAAWTNVENGCALYFYTTDGNASETNVLKIDSNQKATFSGNIQANGDINLTGGLSFDGATAVTSIDTDLASVSGAHDTLVTAKAAKEYADSVGGGVTLSGGADNRIVTATGASALNGESSLTFDGNSLVLTDAVSDTSAGTFIAMDVDFDKTGASTSNNTMIGLNLDMDNTTANSGDNTMTGIKVTPTLNQSGAGTVTLKGIEVVATGDTAPETSTVRALDLTATGGDYTQGIYIATDDANGWDLKIVSSADASDFCTVSVGANGATTIQTTDTASNNADLNLTADGSVVTTCTTATTAQTDITSLAENTGCGDVVTFGTEDTTDTLAAGKLMYLDSAGSGTWKYADADAEVSSKSLLAIALGANVSDGLLIKGYFRFAASDIEGTYTTGAPCFISEAAGKPDFQQPSSAGDYVRVIGYGITNNVIRLDPSRDWIAL